MMVCGVTFNASAQWRDQGWRCEKGLYWGLCDVQYQERKAVGKPYRQNHPWNKGIRITLVQRVLEINEVNLQSKITETQHRVHLSIVIRCSLAEAQPSICLTPENKITTHGKPPLEALETTHYSSMPGRPAAPF